MLPFAKPEEIGIDSARLKRANDLLAAWTKGAKPAVPGGTILVGRRGKIVKPQFFGRQGPFPDSGPIRDDAAFLMTSITKPVVYLGAMLLVEQGQLNLCDPVTRYVPDFAAHHKENTLVQHLFTHTSGMPDMLDNNEALRRAHAPLSRFIEHAVRDTVPLFPAGTNLSYQSMGTLIVTHIIQQLSGQPIAAYLKRNIFDPLGLKSTTLGVQGIDKARIVRVETPSYQVASDFDWNSDYWMQFGCPWGGLYSPPEEFAVICQLLLNKGEYGGVRLLAPGTVERMTTNRLHDQPGMPEAIRRAQPWGLGWRLNHPGTEESWGDLLGPRTFGHTGASGMMVWMDPDREGFCLLSTNALRANAPWRLVQLSNAVAASFV